MRVSMTRERYLQMMNAIRKTKYGITMIKWSGKGITYLTALVYLLCIGFLLWQQDMRVIPFVMAPAVSFVFVSIFRAKYAAPRPYEIYDFVPLLPKDTKAKSFPSRHVFSIFVIATVIVFVHPVCGSVLLCLGVILAVLRVVMGVHFPKDVIAGAVIGIVCGITGMAVWMLLTGCQGQNTVSDSVPKSTEKSVEKAALAGNDNETETGAKFQAETKSLINPAGNTLAERFETPDGFARSSDSSGFAEFLENYKLYPDGKKVKLYNGKNKGNQNVHAAVFKMKLVDGDLQQCADSVMRLYAEYFYQSQQYDKMNFHLVNGFPVEYSKWRQGMRVSVDGDSTSWVSGGQPSDSKQTFEKYLRFVFSYASTLSMEKESKKIKKGQIQAGDIFIYGGSPGHVVMVLDVCENQSGEKAFLLGQGYMPAQQFHVLKNPLHEEDPWYYVSELGYPFHTPEYSFDPGSLRRPEYDA